MSEKIDLNALANKIKLEKVPEKIKEEKILELRTQIAALKEKINQSIIGPTRKEDEDQEELGNGPDLNKLRLAAFESELEELLK